MANRTLDQHRYKLRHGQKTGAEQRSKRRASEPQVGRKLRAAAVGEAVAAPDQSQPWWAADQAMLDEHPPYRDQTKDERKALGAFTQRISAAAVEAAQFLVAGWTGPFDWAFIRLLTIHSFYAALATVRGMRVVPAWLATPEVSTDGVEGMLQTFARLPLEELGPEHIGAVQETLMGHGLVDGEVVATKGRRKNGVHFTPYDLALKVTRRTIEPLLRIVPPEKTLDLRVCDPAVGGGVFLIALVRLLGPRVLRAGLAKSLDEAKRLVAIHCCYGVDVTMAGSMTARLALTLECRACAMPSDWLDDNIKRGDSLVGLSLEQIAGFSWRPSGKSSAAIQELADRAMAQAVAERHARMKALSNQARSA